MLGQIPSNIILSRARPRYWIPSLEVYTHDWTFFELDHTDFFRRSAGLSWHFRCRDVTMRINSTLSDSWLVSITLKHLQIEHINPVWLGEQKKVSAKADIIPESSIHLALGTAVTSSERERVFFKSAVQLARWSRGIWWVVYTIWEAMEDTKAGSGTISSTDRVQCLHLSLYFQGLYHRWIYILADGYCWVLFAPWCAWNHQVMVSQWGGIPLFPFLIPLPLSFRSICQTLTNKAGNQIISTADATRRQKAAVKIHKSQAEANLYLVAHLFDVHCLRVSWLTTPHVIRDYCVDKNFRAFNNGITNTQPVFQQYVLSILAEALMLITIDSFEIPKTRNTRFLRLIITQQQHQPCKSLWRSSMLVKNLRHFSK